MNRCTHTYTQTWSAHAHRRGVWPFGEFRGQLAGVPARRAKFVQVSFANRIHSVSPAVAIRSNYIVNMLLRTLKYSQTHMETADKHMLAAYCCSMSGGEDSSRLHLLWKDIQMPFHFPTAPFKHFQHSDLSLVVWRSSVTEGRARFSDTCINAA